MTRDEAIKELKEYEDGLDLEYATPFDKAILYAIKALEQVPKLQNRCYALTYGQMCIFCPYECTHKVEREDK